jgi:hypothetical protein
MVVVHENNTITRAKAVLKPPQSRRFAQFGCGKQSRSVWTAARLPPL